MSEPCLECGQPLLPEIGVAHQCDLPVKAKKERRANDFYATRPAPGLPGYFAGEDGHIYSERSRRGRFIRLAERLNKDGYPAVQLTYARKSRVYRVHVLIVQSWHGERPSLDHEVRHLDGNPLNNAPSNLAWGTRKENAQDRERHGRTVRGSKMWASVLDEADVAVIRRRLARGETHRAVAADYGVCLATIGHIKSRRNWAWLP